MKLFLIVLDSLGAGALPDASEFGDAGAHTLKSISKSEGFNIPNLRRLGLGNVEGLEFLGPVAEPAAAYGRAMERSRGKDTTVGHWELAGVVSEKPLPTYPNGFPQELLDRFTAETGYEVLCNKPYSGTQVIADYGEEMVRTGKLIVYTSADSVFQIAAHEEVVPLEELYEVCRKARGLLVGEHGVGRVIARPFCGTAGNYTRTANRRDFSLEPPAETLLDRLQARGITTVSVGKIADIFAGRGIDRSIPTHGNAEGMAVTLQLAKEDFEGFVFVNLVDFDMLYGHRQDVDGYAAALSAFDAWLSEFLQALRPQDRVIITADHGCDPGDGHTDHTREYIPLLCYGQEAEEIGTLSSFTKVGEWIEDRFLLDAALTARKNAYAPYSGYRVGAALLTAGGAVVCGSNVENASYGATLCAERSAFGGAVSRGEQHFRAIAVAGGREDEADPQASPCGICRQVMSEFCEKDFKIILGNERTMKRYSLAELLPLSFELEE